MILILLALQAVDFGRDVRPLISEHCLACHGPDAKGDLRLDARPTDLPELLRRITATDGDVMPPRKTGKSLKPMEIDVLRRWIAAGAPWDTHWSFRRPSKAAPPAPGHPVDAFLAARLKREGLAFTRTAAPGALLRRVSLDLTGLPPTPEELDAFLAEGDYAKAVDRLLASPRLGERLALTWMDAARYADTHGLHVDSHRDMWPWRDWVIEAFNRNLPFDRFTIEQLAGDLLPGATREQRIATGFHRNHMISYQGSEIPEKVHAAYVVDRVNTTATVWLGLTFACAQCHDHKFDPVTQRDYYRLFAFFNTVAEKPIDGKDGNAAPVLKLGDKVSTMVMEEMAKPRATHVLLRGDYDRKGERVTPGVPASLPPLPADAAPDRLGLARWLVDPAHPLTARVTVNRFWQMLFGTGIVATSDDFGAQGEYPTHPELLDWLAVDFVESGWDVKRLLKLLVTSDAYRQAGDVTPDRLAKDPSNRLLSRGPRGRLEAELLRDQALFLGGLLVERVGGPSVKPWQPAGVWEAVASQEGKKYTAQIYDMGQGDDLRRRALYTFWKRLAPPPAMTAFDAPSREVCTVRRASTNTPLQALVLLNDRTFFEAAQALGERTCREAATTEARTALLFKRVLARAPTASEAAIVAGLAERRGWTLAASALLNLDEAICR
jgi:hypothetical protein